MTRGRNCASLQVGDSVGFGTARLEAQHPKAAQRRFNGTVSYPAQPHFSLFAATCSALGCSFFTCWGTRNSSLCSIIL